MTTYKPTHPVFILSLPRSGSTLLQRLLATHDDVSTTAEPWVLLPQVYAMRRDGIYTEYGHKSQVRALNEFADNLAGGRSAYDEEVSIFARRLYARAADGARYFVDKTPRYHFIIDDLLRMFPSAHFILLWRNPLAVAASMLSTWGRGRWNLDVFRDDLFGGLERLVESATSEADRFVTVRYEDLVAAPDAEVAELFSGIGLRPVADASDRYRDIDLRGTMGDKVGMARYDTISERPNSAWPRVFGSPLRRRWAHAYLDWIGAARLAAMGYNVATLRAELEAQPRSLGQAPVDCLDLASGRFGRSWPR